jgi:hypothetical protein
LSFAEELRTFGTFTLLLGLDWSIFCGARATNASPILFLAPPSSKCCTLDHRKFFRVSHMTELRTLSSRPVVTVDDNARLTGTPPLNPIGTPAPLGRGRVVSALPMNKSVPVILSAPRVTDGSNGFLIADALGNVLGPRSRVVVHRMLYATPTINTRRR